MRYPAASIALLSKLANKCSKFRVRFEIGVKKGGCRVWCDRNKPETKTRSNSSSLKKVSEFGPCSSQILAMLPMCCRFTPRISEIIIWPYYYG